MQTKYKMDRDTRTLILKYVRKHDEYRIWYWGEYNSIFALHPRLLDGLPSSSAVQDKMPVYMVELEALEQHPRTRVIRAIDRARGLIGIDYDSATLREKLKDAIWLSCLDSRAYPFEMFDGLVGCGRSAFYNYKNQFLNNIKITLHL